MPGSEPGANARVATGGVLWLTAAKFYFMLSGMALLLALPAFFKTFHPDGHVELYGDYRTVIGLVNWCNMVLIGGTIQAVSKFVSEAPGRTDSVKWQTLRIQTVIGGGLTVLILLGASPIARWFYGDEALAPFLRMAAPVVLFYAWYAAIIGCMNGLKRFRHQALMDIAFATLKVGLTIGLVAAGLAITGAVGAFVVTAGVMLVVSWLLLGREGGDARVTWRQVLAFEGQTLVYAFLLNGVLQLDVQILKAFAPERLGDSSLQTGVYAAALQIGQLPYVATLSVAFVIFPLISRSTFTADRARTREYVRTTNRYSLLLLGALATALSCNAGGLLGLVYPEEYMAGAPMLAVLSVGYALLAAAVINASILIASGRPALAVALFAVTLGVSALLNVLLVPRLGGLGAAYAAATAMAVSFVLAATLSWHRFRVFVSVPTVLRIGLAAAVTWALGAFVIPEGGTVLTLGRGSLQFCAFWVVLVATRELTKQDLAAITAARRR
ncbi:MAG: polysaccharide biosynthesis C-terminal domain-containing protein [Pseudomonadota bacterium]